MLHVVADVWADLGDVGKVVAGAIAVAGALALCRWLWKAAKRSLADVVRESSPTVDPAELERIVKKVVAEQLDPIRKEFLVNGGLTARDAINRMEGRQLAIEHMLREALKDVP